MLRNFKLHNSIKKVNILVVPKETFCVTKEARIDLICNAEINEIVRVVRVYVHKYYWKRYQTIIPFNRR